MKNWSDVRVFLAVLRNGSTLAASRKLGMSQPTVARRIEVLEHETGLTLFQRDNRGFQPTEAGLALRPLAEKLEASALELAEKAKELSRPRPIRITAYPANFSPRMTQILSEYSALHPETRFEMIPSVMLLDIAAGEADIALRIVMSDPDPTLIRRKISTARFTLFGAPSYAEKRGLPDSPDNLRGHSFLTYQRDGLFSRHHDWLVRRLLPEQIIMSFAEAELLAVAIRAGRGLGIMNLKMAEPDEAAGRLIRCFEPPPDLSAEHLMLISPNAYRRADVKEFVKFFAPRYAAIFK